MKDPVQQIKDRLAKIADHDTRLVIEHRNAYVRMAKLGYTPEQLRLMLLGLSPEDARRALLNPDFVPSDIQASPPEPAEYEVEMDGIPTGKSKGDWWGFDSKKQASMAYQASQAKPKRAAAIGDAHERVLTLIKNQEPERATGVDQIIMMPAVLAVPAENVKTFRKLASGRMKEITAKAEEPEEIGVIDAAVVEVPA